jgi:hypothetical protein
MAIVCFSCDKGVDFSFTRHEITKEYTYTFTITGTVGENYKIVDPIYLEEILGEEIAKKLTKAELPDSFYIEVTGLNAMETRPALSNFTLLLKDGVSLVPYPDRPATIANRETFGFGNLSSDKKFEGGIVPFFFESLFFFYNHSIKDPALVISFESTEDIVREDKITLNIVFKGTYHYITLN